MLSERFQQIYRQTFRDLRRYVALHCSDPDLIPGLLKKIYLEYYRRLKKEKCGTGNYAVLCKIADRMIFHFDSERTRPRNCSFPLHAENREEWLPENGDPLLQMSEERLWQALRSYPARTRKLFYLCYGEDMSPVEIAKELKLALPFVLQQLYGTLAEIRRKG